MNYTQLEKFIIHRLQHDLPAGMFYHHAEHTKDVLAAAIAIAEKENISTDELLLLKTAAIMHDTGFLFGYSGHETRSCSFAKEILPEYGYDEKSIDRICELIIATKVPQQPTSKLAEILCDADLDYLGRDDFYEIGGRLFEELKVQGLVDTEREWNLVQKTFLESHHYHTNYGQSVREPRKRERLQEVIAKLKR